MGECCGDAPPKSARGSRAWLIAKVCGSVVALAGVAGSLVVNVISIYAAKSATMTREEVIAEISRQNLETKNDMRATLDSMKSMQGSMVMLQSTMALMQKTIEQNTGDMKELTRKSEAAQLAVAGHNIIIADLSASRESMRQGMDIRLSKLDDRLAKIADELSQIKGRLDADRKKNGMDEDEHVRK